jgi:hypothetical protein
MAGMTQGSCLELTGQSDENHVLAAIWKVFFPNQPTVDL